MEFFNFGTPMTKYERPDPVRQATTAVKAPTKLTFQEEYSREFVHGQMSTANMLASLIAKVRYDKSKGKETKFSNWEFLNEDFSKYFQAIMEKHSEEEICGLIDLLLTRRLPFSDFPPPMKVIASNDPKDIIERTKGWEMDFKELVEFTDSSTDTIVATEVKMNYLNWGILDINTSFCCGCEILELPNIENGFSRMETDSLGFVTGSYFLPYNGEEYGVQIRITHCPRNCSTPFTMEQLLLAHTTEPMTPISSSEVPGFKFPVVNFKLTTEGIRGIMGATNENSQIVAIQSDGVIQINKRTPLNWECRSVVVHRDRCMTESREKYMKFFEGINQRRCWFNNMIEIIIEGKVVTAVMVNDKEHIDRN